MALKGVLVQSGTIYLHWSKYYGTLHTLGEIRLVKVFYHYDFLHIVEGKFEEIMKNFSRFFKVLCRIGRKHSCLRTQLPQVAW